MPLGPQEQEAKCRQLFLLVVRILEHHKNHGNDGKMCYILPPPTPAQLHSRGDEHLWKNSMSRWFRSYCTGDFPGGPGVKILPFNAGGAGSTLVWELRFHKPLGQKTKT